MSIEELKEKSDIKLKFPKLELYVLIYSHYDEIIFSEVPYKSEVCCVIGEDNHRFFLGKDEFEWIFRILHEKGDRKTAEFYATKFILESISINNRKQLDEVIGTEVMESIESFLVNNADKFSDLSSSVAGIIDFLSEEYIEEFSGDLDLERIESFKNARSVIYSFREDKLKTAGIEIPDVYFDSKAYDYKVLPGELKDNSQADDRHEWEKDLE